MKEIKLLLSTVVVKFLNHHFESKQTFEISKRSIIRKKIITLLKEAPDDYQESESYNIAIRIKYYKWDEEELGKDVRSKQYFMEDRHQKNLDTFLKKYIKYEFCLWCCRELKNNPSLMQKELIYNYKNIYGFTEEELSFHSLEMSFNRFKRKMKKPEEYFLQITRFTMSLPEGGNAMDREEAV